MVPDTDKYDFDEKELIRKVTINYTFLKKIPLEIQTDFIIDAALETDRRAIMYIKDVAMKTYERCLKAVTYHWELLKEVPEEMQSDEIINIALSQSPNALMHIINKDKITPEMYLEGIKNNGMLLYYIPKKFQTDELIDLAMENSIYAFRCIKDENKKTYERCLRAYREDSYALWRYIPEYIRTKLTEYTEAIKKVKYSAHNLAKISKEMQTDEIIDIALRRDGTALIHIKDESKKTPGRCKGVIKACWELLKYVPKDIRQQFKKELGL